MRYQGERARPKADEGGRHFDVSKLRLDDAGHVTEVLWIEVAGAANRSVGEAVVASTAEVVDAMHDGAQVQAVFAATAHLPPRGFVIVEHEDGRECIAFEGDSSPGRNIGDLARLKP